MALDSQRVMDTVRKGPKCSIGLFVAELTPNDAEQFNEWLADPNVEFTAIARACVREGLVDVTETIRFARRLSSHAYGMCNDKVVHRAV